MGSIARNSKTSSGTTSFAAGTPARAAEVNADFDTVFNEVDGQLNDANIVAAANIDPAKIGDASAAAANQATTNDPGSSTSPSLATTLEEEVQQLRYAIERLALGIDADRNDGSSALDTMWADLPARGDNLIANPSFFHQTGGAGNAPDLWTLEGTPSTILVGVKAAADGDGPDVNIVADAANEGISQTIDGLKASTNYLVVAVVRVNTGEASLKTENGASAGEFQDFDINSTTTGAREILKGVVSTDATPTSLKISIESNAAADDFDVQFVGLYECSADHIATHGPMIVYRSTTSTAETYTSAAWIGVDALSAEIRVPGPGYAIKVTSTVNGETDAGTDTSLVIRLRENINSGGAATVVASAGERSHQINEPVTASLQYVLTNPTPGVTHVYSVDGSSTGGNISAGGSWGSGGETMYSNMIVELIRVG